MAAKTKANDTLSLELSRHKFFAPMASQGGVVREDILGSINDCSKARLVILQGPAGHGKTTTLCQIKHHCEDAGVRTCWLSLDDSDNDPRRFFSHFQFMLHSLLGSDDQGAVPAQIRAGRPGRRPDWVVDQLLNVNEPVALFLDEFQELNNPVVLQFFRDLFMRLPDIVRIYMGSRSIPEIGLVNLKVKQKVQIIQAERLRFSRLEVGDFFRDLTDANIAEAEVEAIYQRCEGWPAALQLFSLSLSSPLVRDSLVSDTDYRPRELAEYLAETVIDLQSDELREFLLKTSVLNRLSASLCDAVTGRSDAQEMLLHLEKNGLFLRSLDPTQQWFKYHTLFSECLREQLREQEGAEEEAHRRAAAWHESHESYEEAIFHYLAIRDYAAAADCLDIWADELVASGQLVTVERWGGRLPIEEILKRPSLAIKNAWALAFLRRYEDLNALLPALDALAGSGDVTTTTDPSVVLSMIAIGRDDLTRSFEICEKIDINRPDVQGFGAFELGAAANLSSFRWLVEGNLELAREHLVIAQDFNTRGETGFSYGYTLGLIGVLMMIQGQLEDAILRMQAGMRAANMHRDKSVASAALASCQMWVLYEAGRWNEAETLFLQHRDIIADGTLMDFLAVAYLCMSRIHTAQGRDSEALMLIDDLDLLARTNRWPRLMRAVGWERVRRALLSGDIQRANAVANICEEYGGECGGRPILSYLVCPSMERIRLAIHNRKLDEAARLLKVEVSAGHGKTQQNIRLQLLEARLWLARNDNKAATRHLRSALQLAAHGGFIQCFLDEGPDLLHLIQEFQKQAVESGNSASSRPVSELAASILKAAGLRPAINTAEESAQQPVAELTEKEQGLLEFLSDGISNKEIAKRLFVSENTVKFHLKNIYSKLGVSSRVQALSAARHQGVLED